MQSGKKQLLFMTLSQQRTFKQCLRKDATNPQSHEYKMKRQQKGFHVGLLIFSCYFAEKPSVTAASLTPH
jgi:hypothetical protein